MDYTMLAAGLNNKYKDIGTEQTSINIASNKKAASSGNGADAVSVMLSGISSNVKSYDTNTYNSLLKEAEDVKSQIMASATDAKANLKALFNKLSGAEAVDLSEDGYNLNEMSSEECVNIVEKIKIELAAHDERFRALVGDMDMEKLKEVVGNAAYSMMPDRISEETKSYMVAEDMKATVKNIYMASHAGSSFEKTALDNELTDWDQLKGQAERIIREAGLEVDDKSLDSAKGLVQMGIPLTAKNLLAKKELDELDISPESVARRMAEGMSDKLLPEDVDLLAKPDEYRVAARVLDTLSQVTYDTWENMEAVVLKEEATADAKSVLDKVSVRSIEEMLGSIDKSVAGKPVKSEATAQPGAESERAVVTNDNYRVLLEVQMMMSSSAGVAVIRQSVDVDNMSIRLLHRNLLVADQEQVMERIGQQLSAEVYEESFSVRMAMYSLERSPMDTIASIMSELGDGANRGDSLRSGYSLYSAQDALMRRMSAYESFMTDVRGELGDSMSVAMENSASDMLDDMGYEDNKSNREAVEILARNQLEIDEENIELVKSIKSELDTLIRYMKPETVLNMIRDNVNPMHADISQVIEYIRSNNDSEQLESDKADKYSTFLYKLDRTEGISSQEREQFIGIYKMMNMFTKDAGAAIGSLLKQGADITMENLCHAYDSRRKAGQLDSTIDDNHGGVEGGMRYYMNLFSATATSITPLTLKNVNRHKPINDRQVEDFCDAARSMYDAKAEAEYMEEYVKLVARVADTDANILAELERGSHKVTINNIQAMEQLSRSDFFNQLLRGKNTLARRVLDSIDDRDSLYDALSDIAKEADKELGEQLGLEDNTFDRVRGASINQMAAKLMLKGADRQDYTIPYVKESGFGICRLTLKSDSTEAGRISISYEDSSMGQVSIEARVTEDTMELSAWYRTGERLFRGVSDEETAKVTEYTMKLEAMGDKLKADYELKSVEISLEGVRSSNRVTYEDSDSHVATAKLYSMAKDMVMLLV